MDAPPPNQGGQAPIPAPPQPPFQGGPGGAPPPQPPPQKGGTSIWKILGIGCGVIVILGIGITGYGIFQAKKFLEDPSTIATGCNIALAVALDDANEFKTLKGVYPKDAAELAAAPLKEPFSKEAMDLVCEKWSVKATDGGQGVLVEGSPKKDPTGKCVITYTHVKPMSNTKECPKIHLK